MRYDKNGFIIFNTATDSEDSPVAAALAMLFTDKPVDVDLYFDNYYYQRCANAKYSVSRDQALALFACIYLKYKNDDALSSLVDTSRVNGNDVFWFNQAHIDICKGRKTSAFQNELFKESLRYAAIHDPHGEQNQMFIQLMVRPDRDKMIKWYCDLNPHWESAVYNWLLDRDEKELAESMTSVIKQILNN